MFRNSVFQELKILVTIYTFLDLIEHGGKMANSGKNISLPSSCAQYFTS